MKNSQQKIKKVVTKESKMSKKLERINFNFKKTIDKKSNEKKSQEFTIHKKQTTNRQISKNSQQKIEIFKKIPPKNVTFRKLHQKT